MILVTLPCGKEVEQRAKDQRDEPAIGKGFNQSKAKA